MRSSEARARNGIADAGRRSSKGLKLRVVKQAPTAAPPASSGEGSSGTQQVPSALYSSQLWQASGHLQQQLSCDRSLYYPELAVAAPVLKYIAEDSVQEVQPKRPRLGAGQQCRQQRCKEAVSDGTPPGTPFKPNSRHCAAAAAEDRTLSNMFASSSSSSSHEYGLSRRQSSSNAVMESDVAWPIVVPHKRRRSSRRRRVAWLRPPSVLQDLHLWVGQDGDAAAAEPAAAATADIAAAAAVAAAFAPSLHYQQRDEQAKQRLKEVFLPPSELLSSGTPHLQQQPAQQEQQQQQQQAVVADASTCDASVSNLQALPTPPDAVAVTEQVVATVAKAAPVAGDASPGQETSQSSDMTCMQEDSPRALVAAVASWPSSSTDSDCQMQQQLGDTHKASLAAAAAAAVVGKRLAGQSLLSEMPSSSSHAVF